MKLRKKTISLRGSSTAAIFTQAASPAMLAAETSAKTTQRYFSHIVFGGF